MPAFDASEPASGAGNATDELVLWSSEAPVLEGACWPIWLLGGIVALLTSSSAGPWEASMLRADCCDSVSFAFELVWLIVISKSTLLQRSVTYAALTKTLSLSLCLDVGQSKSSIDRYASRQFGMSRSEYLSRSQFIDTCSNPASSLLQAATIVCDVTQSLTRSCARNATRSEL